MTSLLIRNAAELVTVAGPDAPRAGAEQGKLEIIKDGAVYCEGERIVAVGPTNQLLRKYPKAKKAKRTIDAAGHAVIPGLVDCHAHPVFAGDRCDEYAMRLAGKSYREILAAGGGILKSVEHTRAATHAELLAGLRARLDAALALGTTTLEAKTGYGLDERTERKMLEVIASARGRSNPPLKKGRQGGEKKGHPIDLVPTLLFAHAVPQGWTADDLADLAVDATPRLAPLAEFVDVFCEKGIFDVEQSRRVLQAGKDAGLQVKVHADEMCLLGGAKLAASLKAVSADHLLYADDESIVALRDAGTIAVFLPGTPFVLRVAYAEARRWIAGNVPVAVGSDLNPNCYCESLPFAFALSVYEMKLTPAEALVAVTINAAAAIRREKEIGSLAPGKLADIAILHGPSYLHLGYHIGGNPVQAVVKRGKVVVE
ncbi:MAG: imidazolonepropionase [Planctomycetes bacterium]|nr:imidazolonepropionase [Planctomycetota bacterium]